MTLPTATPAAGLTREQRIVDRLVVLLPSDAPSLAGVEARSQALPALLRRHGPVQVLLFLSAKAGNDARLAEWLTQGVQAALGETNATHLDPGREAEQLARMELAAYLLRWEIALEVAAWLKMLIGARLEATKQSGVSPRNPPAEEPAPAGDTAP